MLTMLFPGQGSIEAGMGRELLGRWPEAEAAYADAEVACDLPLRELVRRAPVHELLASDVTQPLVFVQSAATHGLLRAAGLRPARVAGHSLGQWAACAAAGALPWPRALALVVQRGRLMAEACRRHAGGMVAVQGIDLDQARAIVNECRDSNVLEVANVNGSHQVVLAGERTALDRVLRQARSRRLAAVPLPVHGAFHTELMSEAARQFRTQVAAEDFSSPQRPLVCGATGRPLTDGTAISQAMQDQMLQPVRWDLVQETLLAGEEGEFVEVGPGRVLTGLLLKRDRRAHIRWTDSGSAIDRVLAAGRTGGQLR